MLLNVMQYLGFGGFLWARQWT